MGGGGGGGGGGVSPGKSSCELLLGPLASKVHALGLYIYIGGHHMHSLRDSLRMEQKNKRQCTYTSCSFDLLTTGV